MFEEYVLKDAWGTLPGMMFERWYERPATVDRRTDVARWSSEALAVDRPASCDATRKHPWRLLPLAGAATVSEQPV